MAVFEKGAMWDIDTTWRDKVLNALEGQREIKIVRRDYRTYVYHGSTEGVANECSSDKAGKYLGSLLIHYCAINEACAEYGAAGDVEGMREARRFALEHASAAERTLKAALRDGVPLEHLTRYFPVLDDAAERTLKTAVRDVVALEHLTRFFPILEHPQAPNWLLFYLPWLAPGWSKHDFLPGKPRQKRATFGGDVEGHLLSKLAPAAEAGKPLTRNLVRRAFSGEKRDQALAALNAMVEDGRVEARWIGRGIFYLPTEG